MNLWNKRIHSWFIFICSCVTLSFIKNNSSSSCPHLFIEGNHTFSQLLFCQAKSSFQSPHVKQLLHSSSYQSSSVPAPVQTWCFLILFSALQIVLTLPILMIKISLPTEDTSSILICPSFHPFLLLGKGIEVFCDLLTHSSLPSQLLFSQPTS